MMRKTTFITIIIQDYNSTYTISCVIGVRPLLMSNDHRPTAAALDNRTGGGGFQIYKNLHFVLPFNGVQIFQFEDNKRKEQEKAQE